jgi:hypothetical protein
VSSCGFYVFRDFLLSVLQSCSARGFVFGTSGLWTGVDGCDAFGHGLVSYGNRVVVFCGVLPGLLLTDFLAAVGFLIDLVMSDSIFVSRLHITR